MTIKLKGSTDGSVSLTAPADTSPTGTDITLTLPTDAGSANQFLKNSGTAGTLDYSSMVEDSSGNVGIGTTSPSNMLHIEGSSPSIRLKVTSGPRHMISPFSGDLYIESDPDNTSASTNTIFTVDGFERMRIDSSGNLLIGSGTSSALGDRLLQVGKTDRTSTYLSIVNSTTGVGGLLFADSTGSGDGGYRGQIDYLHSTDAMRFYTAATERMRITSTGRIRMPNVVGVAGSNLVNVSIEPNGNLCTTTSIRAAKTNISSLTDTSWLFDLNPVTFNWRTKTENEDGTLNWGEEADGGTQYGLVAEEVEEVNTDFCFYNNEGELAGVHYDRLVAPLLKVVQQQKVEIDTLKAKVAALEAA
jgi:hypothetical protein